MVSIGFMNIRKGERIFLAIGLTLLAVMGRSTDLRELGVSICNKPIPSQHSESATRRQQCSARRTVPWQTLRWISRCGTPSGSSPTRRAFPLKQIFPLAILRIPKINLEVPVFNDTDDLTLNRGVGRIIGTAQLGQPGNLGIAGHRDGFFRGLKDVGPNDVIEVIRPGQTDFYAITQMQIVDPENVSVLAPTPAQTLTLVTCYPFYYVGNAPQRYIVTASFQISELADESVSSKSISTGKKTNKKEKQNEIK